MVKNNQNESWASRFGFIMTAAGFAVGLGNMWRFPYLVGTEGGGAFVLIYLLFAVIIGIPLFTMEMSLGRKGNSSPVMGMRKINGKGNFWNIFAWLGVLAAFFILTYYFQIMGWIVHYIGKTLSSSFKGLGAEEVSLAFDSLRANPLLIGGLTALNMAIVGFVSSRGLEEGVERAAKVIMPSIFGAIIFMMVRSLLMEGALEGVRWYLQPDFSQITGKTFLNALGQVFFSIGIASGGAMVYGSYLDDSFDIPKDGLIIISFDTLAALLVGMIMFPAIFSLGMEPGQGPGLLFVTMSRVFSEMAGGHIFGAIFYGLVFLGAFTSAIGYFEPVMTTVRDFLKISRPKAVWISLGIIFVFSIPAILATGPWSHIEILGMNLFDLDDFFSGNILMPLGAIVLIFYTIFKWTFVEFKEDANKGATSFKITNLWKPIVYFVIPIALVVVFVVGIMNVL